MESVISKLDCCVCFWWSVIGPKSVTDSKLLNSCKSVWEEANASPHIHMEFAGIAQSVEWVRYGIDEREIYVCFPLRAKLFLARYLHRTRRLWLQWAMRAVFPGAERPKRDDHSPISSAEVTNARSHAFTSINIFLVLWLIKTRDIFSPFAFICRYESGCQQYYHCELNADTDAVWPDSFRGHTSLLASVLTALFWTIHTPAACWGTEGRNFVSRNFLAIRRTTLECTESEQWPWSICCVTAGNKVLETSFILNSTSRIATWLFNASHFTYKYKQRNVYINQQDAQIL